MEETGTNEKDKKLVMALIAHDARKQDLVELTCPHSLYHLQG